MNQIKNFKVWKKRCEKKGVKTPKKVEEFSFEYLHIFLYPYSETRFI